MKGSENVEQFDLKRILEKSIVNTADYYNASLRQSEWSNASLLSSALQGLAFCYLQVSDKQPA